MKTAKSARQRVLAVSVSVLFFLALLSIPAYSSPLILEEDTSQYTLAPHIELLEDQSANLTLEEILSTQFSNRFYLNKSPVPNMGYTDSAFWVRFKLVNRSEKEMRWFLELGYPTTNLIDLFSPGLDGTYLKQSSGDHYPFSHREVENRNFLFSLTIPPSTTHVYYLRVQSTAVNLALKLWHPKALIHKVVIEYSLLGIYIGALLMIAVYNLFIFTSVKESVYLYYVLYVLGFALAESSLNGTAFQFLWPNQIWLADRMIVLSGGFAVFWGFQFSRSFINTTLYTPQLDRVFRIGMGLTVFTMVISLFNYSLGNQLISGLVLITIPLLLIAGYICRKEGNVMASYYVGAWILVVGGVVIHLLKTFGILPVTFFTNWADELGSVAEVSLLSFGLAARINSLKRAEKEKALELGRKNIELEESNLKLKEYEATLEQKITDRTQELNRQNQKLNEALDAVKLTNLKFKAAKEKAELADMAKSEFLSNISHELRTPMQGILGFALLGSKRIKHASSEKLNDYFVTIHNSGKRLLSLINDLLDLSRMEAGKEDYKFSTNKLSMLTQVVLSELDPLIEENAFQIELDFSEQEASVSIDENRIMQVIRNFLSNAFKFSPATSTISIRISEQSENVHYSITDQGVGVSEDELQSIFDKFSQSTRTKSRAGGTGLGLAICKEIILKHQGEIWAENHSDGGSVFHFQIPKVPSQVPLARNNPLIED